MRSAVNSGNRITTDGLIFYLDVANLKSYISGSTTTTDIKSNIVSTLENGVGYDSDNLGSFVFDGVDDYINCGDNDIFSFGNGSSDFPFSLSAWVKIQGYGSIFNLFRIFNKTSTPGNREYLLYAYDGFITFIMFANYSDSVFIYKRTTDSVNLNQWYNITATYDGRGGSSANLGQNIYINGQLAAANNLNNGTYTAMGNKFAPLNIMGGFGDGAFSDGEISICQIYNKELSPSEVLQNYNALKYRFI